MRINPHIRWLIRRDMEEVLAIERASFADPWTEEGFIQALRQIDCIGLAAEYDDVIVGYTIYEGDRTRLHVLNFAVHPDWRRRGIGEAMITRLLTKLSLHRRIKLTLCVKEDNLDAQIFFRDMGLRAAGIARGYFDGGVDAIAFEYRKRIRQEVEQ